ncbi:MAG: carboxypeptidase-like regulatory domain-containing protein [Campylobacterota bacterium]|nr:carboxypeptidase-like regulatory domain-containing protein [Campylobacterota bacterium]
MKLIFSLLLLTVSLIASELGELSLYVLKDGKPLPQQEVVVFKIDKEAKNKERVELNFKADSDGYIFTKLAEGSYSIHLLSKENGVAQAFVKKSVSIEALKESQVILSLTSTNTLGFSDVEASQGSSEQEIAKVDVTKAKGTVLLSLLSSEDSKKIAEVRIFVKGMSIDVKSDAKGNVALDLPEGEHTLSAIHSDFSAQTFKVKIIAKETVSKLVELTPSAMELEEFVVLAPQVEGSIAALTAEMKKSSSIADILGSEQLSKKGDSNAAAALKRVSGITIVDGKNIYVRGLGERYSNVQMNSMTLPSPDPIKRVVPLDIFPAGVIGSLKVQKSFSADIPANFGGGYIDIRTKKDITEDYIKIGGSLKGNSSTFNEGTFYHGSSSDWRGKDDGTREIDQEILAAGSVQEGEKVPNFDPFFKDKDGNRPFTKDQLIEYTKMLAERKQNTFTKDVPLGYKGSIEFSKRFEINDKHSVGILANYSYEQAHAHYVEETYDYEMLDSGEVEDTPDSMGEVSKTKSKYKHGGMLNLSYNYDDIFNLLFTKMVLLNTDENTRVFDGELGSNDSLQNNYYLEWQERTLDINQLTGSLKYEAYVPMELNFGGEKAYAQMYQPANLKYIYIDYSKTGENFELKTQSTQNLIFHNITSNDDVDHFYANNKMDIPMLSEDDSIIIGIDLVSKYRESRANKYYLSADKGTGKIDDQDKQEKPDFILDKYVSQSDASYFQSAFLIQSLYAPSDYYDATLDEDSIFAKVLLNPTSELEVVFGARQVALKQVMYEYKKDPSNGNLVTIEPNELTIDKILPHFDVKYKLNDDDQLRFAFSQTYVYPDFREFSSSGYDDPDEVATVIGNPFLTHTDITSFDFKYAHYFNAMESMSGSLFYKIMDNPIEDTQLISSSMPVYSFMNSKRADLYGFEIDGYKTMDFVDDGLENYYISGNFSYIQSNVELTEKQENHFTSNNRELQGLSPYVINLSLGYDDRESRSVNFSYNKMGERIRKIGLKNGVKEYPDSVEVPPNILDFTWQEKFEENLKLTFKIRNILDDEIVWKEGENITKRYKVGRFFDVGLSYKY